MALHCVNNAICKCSFGGAPSALGVLPTNRTLSSNQPVATIMDHIPFVNIRPFPPCNAPSNPTNWKGPVFTPGPCVPVTPAPWVVGSPTVLVGNIPALNNTSTLMCTWGGVISVAFAGQATEMIP
jgi:hypothetical protein